MFKFITFVTILAVCYGAPLSGNPEIEIMKAESANGPDGEYQFLYEGSDGSFREEKAVPMNVGQEDEHLAIVGSYRYISADNKEVEVHYTADTRGFMITGQTIRDVGSSRQAKSIEISNKTPSESPAKRLNETPSQSVAETSKETTSQSSIEPISESSSENPSVSSSEASSEQS